MKCEYHEAPPNVSTTAATCSAPGMGHEPAPEGLNGLAPFSCRMWPHRNLNVESTQTQHQHINIGGNAQLWNWTTHQWMAHHKIDVRRQ